MTADAFIAAVRTLVALPQAMVDHLIALAPRLSDTDRAAAWEKLSAEHVQIQSKTEAILKNVDDGLQEIDQIERVHLPQIHNEIEAEEHRSAESIFDDPIPPSS